MLLAAQCHLGSKNLQVHMDPYLWKTRPDGINVINLSKTWYVQTTFLFTSSNTATGRRSSSPPVLSPPSITPPTSV
jgi:ribosomal protein S2